MLTPDPRRQAAIGRCRMSLAMFNVDLRVLSPAPAAHIEAAIRELPDTVERVTLAQLAVLADQCGLRLRIEAVPA